MKRGRSPKPFIIPLCLAVVACSAFIATTSAVSASSNSASTTSFQEDLPILASPPTPLPSAARVAVTESGMAERFGLTEDSLMNSRLIGGTAVGQLFFIPGQRGNCLVLADTVGCTMALTVQEPVVSILRLSPSGHLVGGGVVTQGAKSVTITGAPDQKITLPVDTQGRFLMSDQARYRLVAFLNRITVNF